VSIFPFSLSLSFTPSRGLEASAPVPSLRYLGLWGVSFVSPHFGKARDNFKTGLKRVEAIFTFSSFFSFLCFIIINILEFGRLTAGSTTTKRAAARSISVPFLLNDIFFAFHTLHVLILTPPILKIKNECSSMKNVALTAFVAALVGVASAQCGPYSCYSSHGCVGSPVPVDFVFAVDTSGSMADAIAGVVSGTRLFNLVSETFLLKPTISPFKKNKHQAARPLSTPPCFPTTFTMSMRRFPWSSSPRPALTRRFTSKTR